MFYNFYWLFEPVLLIYMLTLPGYLVSIKLVIIFLNFGNIFYIPRITNSFYKQYVSG